MDLIHFFNFFDPKLKNHKIPLFFIEIKIREGQGGNSLFITLSQVIFGAG